MVNNVMSQGEYMRLYNIYFICKKHNGLISSFDFKANNANTVFSFTNWREIRAALNELYAIDSMKDTIRSLYNSIDPVNRDLDSPSISSNTKNVIVKNQKILLAKMETIIELYESMGNDMVGAGLDIKIPKCSDLKEYMEYLKEIDFILSQCPFLKTKDEDIKFNTVDVGSMWLTFAVVGAGFYILNNMAKLVEKAISIKSNILVYKQQEEQLNEMVSKKEITKDVIDAFKTMKEITLQDAVTSLEGDIAELNDGEERGKTALCLERLVMLIDKGVEIYSSIDTPSEVKVLFPMQETQALLTDDILKLLEIKNDN